MEKTLKKWDFDRHSYSDVPNTYGLELRPPDGTRTRCANCGISITAGTDEGYTSDQWHNDVGFGYLVCDYCFEMELIARKAAEK